MNKRTRNHIIGHVLVVLVWLLWFGGAALQELGCSP